MKKIVLALGLVVILAAPAGAKGLVGFQARVDGLGWQRSFGERKAYELAWHTRLFYRGQSVYPKGCSVTMPIPAFELGSPIVVKYEFDWNYDDRPQHVFQRLYLGDGSGYVFTWGEHPMWWCPLRSHHIARTRDLLPEASPDPLTGFWGFLRPI